MHGSPTILAWNEGPELLGEGRVCRCVLEGAQRLGGWTSAVQRGEVGNEERVIKALLHLEGGGVLSRGQRA